MRTKFKYLITIFIMIILLSTFSFATNTDNDIMPISDGHNDEESSVMHSDLYVGNDNNEIKNIIDGNVFATVKDTLNIDPNDNGGIIQGNLFATAKKVKIISYTSQSETEKDDLGNPAIKIDKHCTISGNVFILADEFTLDSGSIINGDLYICAKEVELSQGSTIYGNVFVTSNKITLNSEIGGSLYANVNNFDMQYFGFVSRDLHLNANDAYIDGYVNRNSFINAKSITTYDKFMNQKDLNITDADTVTFSGEVKGNASINAQNINLKNVEDDKNVNCKILGNLSYFSKENLEVPDGVVSGDVTQNEYNKPNSILSNIGNYILGLIATLICVYLIYLFIKRFIPKYLDKISDISALNLLTYFGIGLLFIILIPIIIIPLLISKVGIIVGVILLLLYMILIIIAEPIFIISVATFLKNKVLKNFNVYLTILVLVILLSLLKLIPYVRIIIFAIITLIGFGTVIKNLIPKNK